MFTKREQGVIDRALQIMEKKVLTYDTNAQLNSVDNFKAYITLKIVNPHQEYFWVGYLSSQHQLIKGVVEFKGTIDSASVYPRIIAKHALELGAAAIVLAHNHPSGYPEPSLADKNITSKITNAMNMIDITVLDHFIVGPNQIVSFAQRGLI